MKIARQIPKRERDWLQSFSFPGRLPIHSIILALEVCTREAVVAHQMKLKILLRV